MDAFTPPDSVHFGRDDLPFVDIGEGAQLKVLQVKLGENLWIIENIFQAGYEVIRHRHSGPVFGYTTSGAWKYKEYDYVNREGSFLYEPAGSVHTLQPRAVKAATTSVAKRSLCWGICTNLRAARSRWRAGTRLANYRATLATAV